MKELSDAVQKSQDEVERIKQKCQDALEEASKEVATTKRLLESLDDNERLREQAKQAEQSGLCAVCREEKANALTMLCRHVVMCMGCWNRIQDQRNTTDPMAKCPACRQPIQAALTCFIQV